MKRLRRFLEILAACALAGLLACWLAQYSAEPRATAYTASDHPQANRQAPSSPESSPLVKVSEPLPLENNEFRPVSDGQGVRDEEDRQSQKMRCQVVGRGLFHGQEDNTGWIPMPGVPALLDHGSSSSQFLGAICLPNQVQEKSQENVLLTDRQWQTEGTAPPLVHDSVEFASDKPQLGNLALVAYQEEQSRDAEADIVSISVNPQPDTAASSAQFSSGQVINIVDDGNRIGSAKPQSEPVWKIFPVPPPESGNSPQAVNGSEITSAHTGLQIELRDSDIRDAIHALAKMAGLNVVLSSSVQGKVTVSLNGLSPREAIFAILRVPGFVSREHEGIVYVGTEQEMQNLGYITDRIATRIYRPNYTPAKELEALVKPLLTPQIGLTTVSTAAESGISPDPSNAGGDKYAGTDVLIVRDYQRVLEEIDQIVQEVDVRPAQVAIEAMILSVNLDDEDQFGVSFELLRNRGYIKFGWGLVPQNLSDIKFDNNGMKLAFLDGSIGAFINALQSIGDTNVIATPRLLVLNKHRAEILIGQELGYVSTTFTETSSSQTVDFLKVGAQLVIRPFISNDGLIRMEVHPELSTGSVQITNNFTVPNKETTQVTTNIMVPDGMTVVIGGLMREDLETTASQIPFFGNLPLIGAAFRNKMETTKKQEIIVLITPYIVDDYQIATDGAIARSSWRRRQEVASEEMSGWNKQNAAQHFLEKAKMAYAEGRCNAARHWAEMAVEFDPSNMEAIAFRDQLRGIMPKDRGPLFPPKNR
ncbi:MAG: type II secretion system protein GspD [Thermogutta sp.]